jgi:nucleotide-binding universal stress UspA family protein
VKSIVVGYDGTEGSRRALDRAVELARALSAKLTVVSVTELPVVLPPYGVGAGAGLAAVPLEDPGLVELETNPEKLVAGVLDDARSRAQGVDADFVARVGEPDDALVEVADELGADLLVVGTREPGFLDRVLAGSVSNDLARRAHCDVLIVHPPHAKKKE